MQRIECEFEAEVLSAVMQLQWPARADAGLRAHVTECSICSDVAAVAGVIDAAREQMRAAAAVPDSGRIWWRAQLRARREAAKTAGRPITAIQVMAFACAIGLLGACFGATSTWFQESLHALARVDWIAMAASHLTLVIGMAALLFVVPAAVYLAMGRD